MTKLFNLVDSNSLIWLEELDKDRTVKVCLNKDKVRINHSNNNSKSLIKITILTTGVANMLLLLLLLRDPEIKCPNNLT